MRPIIAILVLVLGCGGDPEPGVAPRDAARLEVALAGQGPDAAIGEEPDVLETEPDMAASSDRMMTAGQDTVARDLAAGPDVAPVKRDAPPSQDVSPVPYPSCNTYKVGDPNQAEISPCGHLGADYVWVPRYKDGWACAGCRYKTSGGQFTDQRFVCTPDPQPPPGPVLCVQYCTDCAYR
jgi:hypothetical protein